MKRCLAILLSVVMLFVCLSFSAAATDFNLLLAKHYDDPLINAIANVQRVTGDDIESVLTGEKAPGIALASVADLTDVTAFMQLCVDNAVVPTFYADTTKEAQVIVDAMTATSCKDVTVISSDPMVLKYVRNKKLAVRTGFSLTLEKDTVTSEEAHALRTTVRSAPATFCVIEAAFASRQLVSELQELAVAVWVETEDNDASILRAITSGANGVITSSASDTAQMMTSYFQENTMTRTPVMIGHRGNPTQAPENSLSGFLKAYENGADVFEVDVEITKDKEIIIMHDDTLNRTTNYDGDLTVSQMTLKEIKQYRLKALDGSISEETVPTFREVLEAFQDKDCRIFIEFKGYNASNVSEAMALVQEYDMEDRVDVISFNSGFLTQTQTVSNGMSTGFLQSPSGATTNELIALETFYSSIINTNNVNSTINPNKGVISKPYLQVATDRGMTIWPWTYSLSTANMAFLLCPDGVTTDDVQWSKDMLKFIETPTTVRASIGDTVSLSVTGMTYGREQKTIADGDLIVKIISGEDVLKAENGKWVAKQNGTAQVMFGYETQTTGGSTYVLYTQPVTVEIAETIAEQEGEATPFFTPMMIAIFAAAAVLLVGVVVVLVILKKK